MTKCRPCTILFCYLPEPAASTPACLITRSRLPGWGAATGPSRGCIRENDPHGGPKKPRPRRRPRCCPTTATTVADPLPSRSRVLEDNPRVHPAAALAAGSPALFLWPSRSGGPMVSSTSWTPRDGPAAPPAAGGPVRVSRPSRCNRVHGDGPHAGFGHTTRHIKVEPKWAL